MNVAIIHDSLNEFGGAERVLQSLIKLFPSAQLYTAYYDNTILKTHFPHLHKKNIHTTIAQNSSLKKHTSLFQILSPLLWKNFNLKGYDFIISNSAFINANLVFSGKNNHIQFIQSPPKNIFGLSEKSPLQKIIPYHLFLSPYIRKHIHKSPFIIANSTHMKKTIDEIYSVNSTVIYPPTNIQNTFMKLPTKKEYFFIVSRIDRTKGIELAIKACVRMKYKLKIVGKTNEIKYLKYLQSISDSNIEFLGEKPDKEISLLYRKAKAFIFTAYNEDFGIAPIEAMGHGVPVIAFYGGGPKETVVEGVTGIFFQEYTPESLIDSLKKFSTFSFNSKKIHHYAKKYSEQRFRSEVKNYIRNLPIDFSNNGIQRNIF